MKFAKQQQIIFNNNEVIINLFIPADLFWFKGHFPTQAILPGVIQLDWAIHYAKKFFHLDISVFQIDFVKFQNPILPNSEISLYLTWQIANQKLLYRYTCNNHDMSSGRILLCNNAN
ncbi:hydroxymyristoyl-ACP dehydratase [Orbaceae bacterium ESL0721]|nr:hydroxymyristoyl-ACP dehydratase [Orbaceae bacterium ESL0721]